MDNLKNKPITEFTEKLIAAENIFNEIYYACNKTFWRPCGSYLFDGHNYAYDIRMLPKQELLYSVSKNADSVLEIGTYMGHSLLIMLLANPKMKITSIDIDKTYAQPAIITLRKHFPLAEIEFINGNSLDVLPTINNKKFDLFHIDGYHADSHIECEMQHCINLTLHLNDKKTVKIIFDDVDCCSETIHRLKSKYKIKYSNKPDCIHTNMYIEFEI